MNFSFGLSTVGFYVLFKLAEFLKIVLTNEEGIACNKSVSHGLSNLYEAG